MGATPRAPAGWLRRPGEWSLRARLVSALTAVAVVGLVAANVAGVSLLRSYLLDRVDDQLRETMRAGPGPVTADDPLPHFFREEEECGPFSRLGPRDVVVRAFDADGTVLRDSTRCTGDGPDLPRLTPDGARRMEAAPFTTGSERGDTAYRVVVQPYADGVVAFATNIDQVSDTVRRLALIDALVTLLVLALLAVLALSLVRVSLRPLLRIEQTAAGIAAGDLSRRVPAADRRTEVGRLGAALNAMLTQIETAFSAQRRSEERLRHFVADASHELRTPLTSIRGFAEMSRLRNDMSEADRTRAMQRIEDEARRMGSLVDDLLLLARLDQQRPLERAPVDLLVLAGDAVHDAQAHDPGREVRLAPLPGGSLAPTIVSGDQHRLRQVVGNLMANAVAHTPAGTPVEVRVGVRGAGAERRAVVEVADRGPGMSPEQARRVFERFYRADQSRARGRGGGAGLGLSIVAAVVAAHGGDVEVDTAPGQGATFRVLLPA